MLLLILFGITFCLAVHDFLYPPERKAKLKRYEENERRYQSELHNQKNEKAEQNYSKPTYEMQQKKQDEYNELLYEFEQLGYLIKDEYEKVDDLISQLKRNMNYIRRGEVDAEDMAEMRAQLDDITDNYYYWRETIDENKEKFESMMQHLPKDLTADQRKKIDDIYQAFIYKVRVIQPKLKDTYEAYAKMLQD